MSLSNSPQSSVRMKDSSPAKDLEYNHSQEGDRVPGTEAAELLCDPGWVAFLLWKLPHLQDECDSRGGSTWPKEPSWAQGVARSGGALDCGK